MEIKQPPKPLLTRNEDGTFTLKLAYPIAGEDGSTIAELMIRRPTAKALKGMDALKGEVIRTCKLIELLTGLKSVDVEKMDGEDYNAVNDAIAVQMGKAQATGAPS